MMYRVYFLDMFPYFQFGKLCKNFDIILAIYCKRFFIMQQCIQRQSCQMYNNVFGFRCPN